MSELTDLYQDVVLEHSKHPRNYRALENATHQAEGFNPLCGDHFTVYVDVQDDRIREVSFQGSGCAISKASASIMTQALKGRTTGEADALFENFHRVVTGETDAEGLGKLAAFAGVSEFPARVKCAILAWHTVRAALQREQQAVSTE
jgi:nitrogen fixation protein NifU and related proteins